MSYTPPSTPFQDNASPVGGGLGQPLSAAFFTELVAGVDDADTRLTALESGAGRTTVTVDGTAVNNLAIDATPITKTSLGLGNVDNTSDLSKPISTATQAALDNKATRIPAAPTGVYFYPISAANQFTTNGLGVGTLRLVPWLVDRTITLDRVGIEVTVAGDAGSRMRIGIYADTGLTYPGSLILDAGQVATDAVALPEAVITATTLTPGLWWIGGVVQAVTTTQPTVRAPTTWTPPVLLPTGTSVPSTSTTLIGYSHTGVTGALPATFTTTRSGVGSAVRLFMRTA